MSLKPPPKNRQISLEWAEESSLVFVRDKHFGWLPAKLVQPINDGDTTASVSIALPQDWHDYTVDSSHPSLGRPGREDEQIRTVKLTDYPGGDLPLQNVDQYGVLVGKNDMSDLPFLHEAAILYNLKDRHINDVPYTRVGNIIVAMNPFQWIDGLYSDQKKKIYSDRLIWNAGKGGVDMQNQKAVDGYFERITPDPHVYETSAHAYHSLAVDRKDQAILVSGESGAGKTETVKIVMNHLATVQDTCPYALDSMETDRGRTGIVRKVLDSNPVFEAFGNAQTVRNDNSSRFGKFTKLWFDIDDIGDAGVVPMTALSPATSFDTDNSGYSKGGVPRAVLSGSSFETYLLEKARVVGHAPSERTFHIFYQLLAAPEEYKSGVWSGLSGATPDAFRYLGTPDIDSIGGQTDAESWKETRKALKVFGIRGEEMFLLLRALCTVLQMGNLEFSPDPSDDDGSLVASFEELKKLSDLMGVAPDVVQNAMTTRLMQTRGEQFTVRLSVSASRDSRDALAKEIYAQLFEMLVRKMNDSTRPPDSRGKRPGANNNFHSISLLDLFGFEVFEVNRFEQLCINYANEHLQQKYVMDNFRAVQEEYMAEGIELYDFSEVDNSDVLELIEGRIGLIGVLNDECIHPKGNDVSFVYKVKTIHKDSRRLVSERLHRPCEFGIKHFASLVTYDASNFVERNRDKLPGDLLNCACKCTNETIRKSFERLKAERLKQESLRSSRGRGSAAKTICTKFKKQVASLMANLKEARTRFVRCIKPNTQKMPHIMDHALAMTQLGSAGLVTAITISRETFPNRLSYKVVVDRFACLSPSDVDLRAGVKASASRLLATLLEGKEKVVGGHVIAPYACGKTKVFFRSGSLELLESDRMRLYSEKATVIQCCARRFITQRKYQIAKAAAIRLQSYWRCRSGRKSFLEKREAAVTLQSLARYFRARDKLRGILVTNIVTKIQSRWRARKRKVAFSKFKAAAGVIQRAIKSKRDQTNFTSALAILVEEASKDYQMKKLQFKLSNVSSDDDKDELLRECNSMISYLGAELYKQRVNVSDVRDALYKERDYASEQKARADSAEAALSASKIDFRNSEKANRKLRRKYDERKSVTCGMRNQLNNLNNSLVSTQSAKEEEVKSIRESYEKESYKLKNELQQTRQAHFFELSTLEEEHEESIAALKAENEKLKEQLRKEEEEHERDLSAMLEALERAGKGRDGDSTIADDVETNPPQNEVPLTIGTSANIMHGLPYPRSELPLEDIAASFREGVKVKDRRHRLRTYKKCFVGSEGVDFLVFSGFAHSRKEAVQIGRKLMRESVFKHVSGDHDFKDEYLFYKFLSGEGDKLLSMTSTSSLTIGGESRTDLKRSGWRW